MKSPMVAILTFHKFSRTWQKSTSMTMISLIQSQSLVRITHRLKMLLQNSVEYQQKFKRFQGFLSRMSQSIKSKQVILNFMISIQKRKGKKYNWPSKFNKPQWNCKRLKKKSCNLKGKFKIFKIQKNKFQQFIKKGKNLLPKKKK